MEKGLYIVSTPIGNLEDITLRAIKVLENCDRIICEDTRVSNKLLNHYNIKKPLIAYHEHSDIKVEEKILSFLINGESIALVSDAGTPLISDPGFKIVQSCYKNKIKVTTIPGATAFISASILSGFPTNNLSFLGFASDLSNKTIIDWKDINCTIALYESPHKLIGTLKKLKDFMFHRDIAVIREMTKLYEEIKIGNFEEIIEHFSQNEPKGEFVIVLSPPKFIHYEYDKIKSELNNMLKSNSLKDAVDSVAARFNLKKKEVYEMALNQQKETI